ncbi:MAG: hypothetical protein HY064_13405 [Bacteroidetes bacterium]|nr:hypothetical protein [Bacteroidota bacterium]
MQIFNNPGPGKITLLLSFSMVFIFLGLGYLFLATNVMPDRFPKPNRIYIGLVLVVWALFRGVTVWLKYKRELKDEEDE